MKVGAVPVVLPARAEPSLTAAVVDYRVMNTQVSIIIHGFDATTTDFAERLEDFLSVDQPWLDDPAVRLVFSVRAVAADAT